MTHQIRISRRSSQSSETFLYVLSTTSGALATGVCFGRQHRYPDLFGMSVQLFSQSATIFDVIHKDSKTEASGYFGKVKMYPDPFRHVVDELAGLPKYSPLFAPFHFFPFLSEFPVVSFA
jgi:hypothetical protein